MSDLPGEVALNAWTGSEAAHGGLDDAADRWGSRGGLPRSQQALPLGLPPDLTRWSDPDVGYGILLAENPDVPAADKARCLDAPDAIRELLAARPGTVILRYDPALRRGLLRRYFDDGTTQTPEIGTSRFGSGPARLPLYVLLVGEPDTVPWSLQYDLGTRHAVGRLPLTGAALGNYIAAMLDGWSAEDVDVRGPLMWTVDLPGDITAEMRAVIANPLAALLTDPKLPRFGHITDGAANASALLSRLATSRPALVVTSSHGATVGDPPEMRATLGLPVDQAHAIVGLDALDAAMPGGAIWYAQACCSGGSEGPSKYTGLLRPGSSAEMICAAVGALGSTVAPAAVRLLGRTNPLRAVVGHVEPTFDWTLRVAETKQGLGHHLTTALSTNLYAGQPIGLAFAEYRDEVGVLHGRWISAFDDLSAGDVNARPTLTRLRLTAFDRQSLVLLGDPTVTLPPLASAP